MKIISSTGGGGSSFVADKFAENRWAVCLRPDGGQQKATHTEKQIYDERTAMFFKTRLQEKPTQKEMFLEAYSGLKKIPHHISDNIMLLCMTWGGLGFLNDLEENPCRFLMILCFS